MHYYAIQLLDCITTNLCDACMLLADVFLSEFCVPAAVPQGSLVGANHKLRLGTVARRCAICCQLTKLTCAVQ